MTDFADLGANFTATGGAEFIATTKGAGTAATATAAATDKLNTTQARHAKALRDYATAIRANAAANAVANQAAASGMRKLAEAEAAVRARMTALPALHLKGAAAAKLQGHELLNLSRQFSDIGVTAAMGMNPLMILIQQGPQIAETMAMAAARGVTLKAALADLAIGARALWVQFAPLLVAMAPFIAIAAAIAAAAWLVTKRFQEMKAKNEEITASATKLRDALGKVDPALNAQANASELAAEGARNFATWIEDGNKKLGTYAEQLKTATVNQLMFNAAQAAGLAQQYRENNTRRTPRGVVLNFGVNAKEYAAEQARLDQLSADSDALARKGLNAPLVAFTGPAKKAAKGADEAAEALKRLKAEFADLVKNTNNPDPALRKIADDMELLNQAAAAGLVSGAAYVALFNKLREKEPARERLKEQAKFAFIDLENKALELDATLNSVAEQRMIDFREAAEGVGGLFDEAFRAMKGKNWMDALGGLFDAIDKLKADWASLSTSGKIGAVAGIANAAGGAIGGAAGSGLMGAASGAMLGMKLGTIIPGVGNVVGAIGGAIIGGIAGIFSGSKAKKQAKAQEEAQRLADAAARALEIENQAREINIAMLQAQGKTEEALAVQRAYQLTQTATVNQDALRALWALEDAQRAATLAQEAAAAALEEANAARDMHVRLLEAMGRGEEALALTRQIEMEQTRESLRGTLQQIYDLEDASRAAEIAADALRAANDELSQARDREAGAIQNQLDKLRDSRAAMLAFRDALTPISGTAAGGSALEAFKAAALQAANDNGASFDKQQATSEAYLEVSRNTASTALDELRATAKVREALDLTLAANGVQINVAQAQLDSLNAAVDAILLVDSSVKTVAQLLAARNAVAQASAGAVGGAGGGGPTYYDSASDSWKPSASGADVQRLMGTLFTDPTGMGYNDTGYSRLLLDQFNSGGFDHLRDSEGNATGVLAQILSAGFERLTSEVAKGNNYAQTTADTLDRVTEGGNGMVVAA